MLTALLFHFCCRCQLYIGVNKNNFGGAHLRKERPKKICSQGSALHPCNFKSWTNNLFECVKFNFTPVLNRNLCDGSSQWTNVFGSYYLKHGIFLVLVYPLISCSHFLFTFSDFFPQQGCRNPSGKDARRKNLYLERSQKGIQFAYFCIFHALLNPA